MTTGDNEFDYGARTASWRRIAWILLTPLLLLLILVGGLYWQGIAGGRPVDLGKIKHHDHLLYERVDPVSRNYLQVVEDLQMEGVTSENNFAVTLFELSLRSDVPLTNELAEAFGRKFHSRHPAPFALVRCQELDADPQSIAIGLKSTPIRDLLEWPAGKNGGVLSSAVTDPNEWALIGKWLSLQDAALDELVDQVQLRTEYAYPFADQDVMEIRRNQRFSMVAHMATSWLACRGQYRLHEGDWDGSWQDTRGILQVSQRLTQGAFFDEVEDAHRIQHKAVVLLQLLLNDAGLTEERLRLLEKELPIWLPLPDGSRQYNLEQRAMASQVWDQVICHGKWDGEKLGGNSPDPLVLPGWVDTVRAFDQVNELVDFLRDGLKTRFRGEAPALQEDPKFLTLTQDMFDIPSLWGSPVGSSTKGGALKMSLLLSGYSSRRHSQSQLRLLKLTLALRRWELDNGSLTDDLPQLGSPVDARVLSIPFEPANWQAQWREGLLWIGDAREDVDKSHVDPAFVILKPLR